MTQITNISEAENPDLWALLQPPNADPSSQAQQHIADIKTSLESGDLESALEAAKQANQAIQDFAAVARESLPAREETPPC